MKLTYIVTLIVFLLVASCYQQELSLTNSVYFDFVPDTSESVFIASSQGIVKFDGTKISKIYRSDNFSYSNMEVDEQNNLWTIVTRYDNNSLYCFESNDIKTYFLPDPPDLTVYKNLGSLNFKHPDKSISE